MTEVANKEINVSTFKDTHSNQCKINCSNTDINDYTTNCDHLNRIAIGLKYPRYNNYPRESNFFAGPKLFGFQTGSLLEAARLSKKHTGSDRRY